jgi:hypothetical protein
MTKLIPEKNKFTCKSALTNACLKRMKINKEIFENRNISKYELIMRFKEKIKIIAKNNIIEAAM